MVVAQRKIDLYQINLLSKANEIEDLYYDQVDQLYSKLKDIGVANIPSMELIDFQFITDWECGNISSEEVRDLFDHMDIREAAKNKITKRLTIQMTKALDEVTDYYKTIIAELNATCVPKMVNYLEMLKALFNNLSDIDEDQVPMTWIEQTITNGTFTTAHYEVSFNQLIRQIDTFVSSDTQEVYYYRKNVLMFDETPNKESKSLHWIFGPEAYINELKKIYEVKAQLNSPAEISYLMHFLKES